MVAIAPVLQQRKHGVQRVNDSPALQSIATCNTCTLRLVKLCYQRHWWFRLIREPLVLAMRAMARWHRIDPTRYRLRAKSCHGCVRFMKNALKEESPAFRWLNARVDPLFNRLRNSMLKPGEIEEARGYARQTAEPMEEPIRI